MEKLVYIRFVKKLTQQTNDVIAIRDMAYLSTISEKKEQMLHTTVYRISESDSNIVVIDAFTVIDTLQKLFPDHEFQLFGSPQTIVSVQKKHKRVVWPLAVLIWILLFIGSAMTIMNFHFDVGMQPVQQQLHFLLTGERIYHPLWLQIPYSLGLGLGMILFFNHVFKKRLNEEPSPLEVEMHNYQRDLDAYVAYHENTLEKTHDSAD